MFGLIIDCWEDERAGELRTITLLPKRVAIPKNVGAMERCWLMLDEEGGVLDARRAKKGCFTCN